MKANETSLWSVVRWKVLLTLVGMIDAWSFSFQSDQRISPWRLKGRKGHLTPSDFLLYVTTGLPTAGRYVG